MNICVKCDNHIGFGVVDHFCEVPDKINYVTGKQLSVRCESKNIDGNCADYREKGVDK